MTDPAPPAPARLVWPTPVAGEVFYPSGDGKPVAENTTQFDWIVTLKGGLDELFADREDVFVAADLFWYPREGDNRTRVAPDVMVALGRPRGPRLSYLQWREGGVAPQVVFEILSPGNRQAELARKFAFYEGFGVREYYTYNPFLPATGRGNPPALRGWQRTADGSRLTEIPSVPAGSWRSPLLGVAFERDDRGELRLVRPDGRPFRTWLETVQDRTEEATRARQEQARAREEHARAQREHARAEALAARLRGAGLDPDQP